LSYTQDGSEKDPAVDDAGRLEFASIGTFQRVERVHFYCGSSGVQFLGCLNRVTELPAACNRCNYYRRWIPYSSLALHVIWRILKEIWFFNLWHWSIHFPPFRFAIIL